MTQQTFSEKDSLALINEMINRAKNSFIDTGIGPILWGTVITVCSLVTYGQVVYGWKLPFNIWWLTLVAIIPQIIISNKERKMRKAKSHNDVVMNYVWMSFGFSIGLMSFVMGAASADLEQAYRVFKQAGQATPSFRLYEYSSSAFLILYGFPTVITGAVTGFKPMLFGGLVCWICCVVAIYTNGRIDLLLTALSATCAWLIPGLILQQKYLQLKKKRIHAV